MEGDEFLFFFFFFFFFKKKGDQSLISSNVEKFNEINEIS